MEVMLTKLVMFEGPPEKSDPCPLRAGESYRDIVSFALLLPSRMQFFVDTDGDV